MISLYVLMVALTKKISFQFRNKAFSKQVNFCIRKKEKSIAGFFLTFPLKSHLTAKRIILLNSLENNRI